MNDLFDPRPEELSVSENLNDLVKAIAAVAMLISAIASIIGRYESNNECIIRNTHLIRFSNAALK